MITEQLFVKEPTFLSNFNLGKGYNVKETQFTHYCSCERPAGEIVPLDEFNTGQCNLTGKTEFCSEFTGTEKNTITSFYTSCLISERKQRSVKSFNRISSGDDVIDFSSLTYDETVLNTEVKVCYHCILLESISSKNVYLI